MRFPEGLVAAALLLVMLQTVQAGGVVRINEVMYNPLGRDDQHEFVEVFGTSDLSGYSVGDAHSNDSLVWLKAGNGSYALIVEEGFNYSGINASVYSAGKSIGNGLGNKGDVVRLYFNGSLVDEVYYDASLANGNGKSLEYWNGSWKESLVINGTPGEPNSWLFRNDSSSESDSSLKEEGWAGCDAALEVERNPPVYEAGETVVFALRAKNFTANYWVEDLFNRVVRKAKTTSRAGEKRFTPKPKERVEAYLVKADFKTRCGEAGREAVVVFRNEDAGRQGSTPRRSCEEERRVEEAGNAEITSFQSRKKVYAPRIRVEAWLRGEGFYKAVLVARNESWEEVVVLKGVVKKEWRVGAEPGWNLYLLELRTPDSRVASHKYLRVFLREAASRRKGEGREEEKGEGKKGGKKEGKAEGDGKGRLAGAGPEEAKPAPIEEQGAANAILEEGELLLGAGRSGDNQLARYSHAILLVSAASATLMAARSGFKRIFINKGL